MPQQGDAAGVRVERDLVVGVRAEAERLDPAGQAGGDLPAVGAVVAETFEATCETRSTCTDRKSTFVGATVGATTAVSMRAACTGWAKFWITVGFTICGAAAMGAGAKSASFSERETGAGAGSSSLATSSGRTRSIRISSSSSSEG